MVLNICFVKSSNGLGSWFWSCPCFYLSVSFARVQPMFSPCIFLTLSLSWSLSVLGLVLILVLIWSRVLVFVMFLISVDSQLTLDNGTCFCVNDNMIILVN